MDKGQGKSEKIPGVPSVRQTLVVAGLGVLAVSVFVGIAWYRDQQIRAAHERAYEHSLSSDERSRTDSIEETKRRGETIIAALSAFHKANRAYPEWLSDLVPAYLPSLPRPHYGPDDEWFYAPTDDHLYQLSFREADFDDFYIEIHGRRTNKPRWLYLPKDHAWTLQQ